MSVIIYVYWFEIRLVEEYDPRHTKQFKTELTNEIARKDKTDLSRLKETTYLSIQLLMRQSFNSLIEQWNI